MPKVKANWADTGNVTLKRIKFSDDQGKEICGIIGRDDEIATRFVRELQGAMNTARGWSELNHSRPKPGQLNVAAKRLLTALKTDSDQVLDMLETRTIGGLEGLIFGRLVEEHPDALAWRILTSYPKHRDWLIGAVEHVVEETESRKQTIVPYYAGAHYLAELIAAAMFRVLGEVPTKAVDDEGDQEGRLRHGTLAALLEFCLPIAELPAPSSLRRSVFRAVNQGAWQSGNAPPVF